MLAGLGSAGIARFSPTGENLEVFLEDTGEVLSIRSLGNGSFVAAGTRGGIAILNGDTFEVVEFQELLSGVTTLGSPTETEEGGWEVHFLNPLGIGKAQIDSNGSLQSLPEVLDSVGAHPVRLHSNVASLWSELIIFDPAGSSDEAEGIVVRARHSLLQAEEGRSVYRHYTDVHRAGATITATHDAGVSFLALEPQFASPDIHSQYTVLKMYTTEAGATTSAIAKLLNLGEAPLEILSIESTHPAFSLTYDAGPDSEPGDAILIEPGGSTYFEVAFDGSVEAASTTIRVESNDPDEGLYEITARVNHPNAAVGDSLSTALVPDGRGRYRSLGDWSNSVKYIKLFNGL